MVYGVNSAYIAGAALTDKSKGSLNNRLNCAGEHIKNNLRTGLPIAAATAAGTVVALTKPTLATKIATTVGKGIGSIGKFLADKVFKGGLGTGVLKKVLANPTKAGAIGIAAAGGMWVLNKLLKHSYTAGQIDQKYTDAAILEAQSKNIVLER